MWDFTEENKKEIEEIYQHFLPLLPNADPEKLYDRIFCGYCWGENGKWLLDIEDWERVLL